MNNSNMGVRNLVLTLLARERKGTNYQRQQFEEVLEYKTATSSTIHINYNLQEQTRSTFVVAFSPDRTKIATSHGNHSVKISDCFTFKILLTLKGHPRTPWCVTFHPTINSLLATGCLGGQVRLWDLNKVTTDDNIVYESQAVISSLAFHPTQDILAISTHNKLILYDWNRRSILKTIQMKHHSQSIRLVRFLPNGSKIITAIANTSSKYCKPERFNVSTRGDGNGRSVVQTVSCMRLQQQAEENEDSPERVSSTRINTRLKRKGYALGDSHDDNKKSRHSKISKSRKSMGLATSSDSSKTNISAMSTDDGSKCEGTSILSTTRLEGTTPNESSSHVSGCESAVSTTTSSTIKCASVILKSESGSTERCGGNGRSTSTESTRGASTSLKDSAVSESSKCSKRSINSSNKYGHKRVPDSSEDNEPSRLHQGNTRRQLSRSERWKFLLDGNISSEGRPLSENLNEVDVNLQGTTSSFSGDEYLNIHQSTHLTNYLGVQTAVATATARSCHHVHTAVVIASEEQENCETTLQTAVNRAIAGAFAGSGEGAVANNIIDTTHRLQMWDSSFNELPDIQNEKKNVIVPLCKIHNDSSLDVSQDSSFIAVFVPNEYGFPMDAEIKVISLRTESFLHCIYSRKFGPNAVSVSLSSLNNYIMIGLASRKLHWELSSNQLIGQILQLPSYCNVNYEDICKPVLSIFHECNQSQRTNVSVNTLRFHPTPGMGIVYGTNRGHVQHCHIQPDFDLIEKRLKIL